jgi:peptidoglycan-associated lipoprotein
MNLSKIIISLSIVFLVTVRSSYAQKSYTKDAKKAYTEERYFDAIELFKKAYAQEKSNAEKSNIIFKIAECYRQTLDNAQAEVWYKKAIQASYQDPIAVLYLADALKAQGRYPEAVVEYSNYKAAEPKDKRGDIGVKSCEQAQKWVDEPTRYVVYPEAQLNSRAMDFCPTYTDKKYNSLIFTSSREGSVGTNLDGKTGQNFSDLYESTRDKNGKWSTPSLVKGEVNSENSEGASVVNKKGSTIYFTRCPSVKDRDDVCYIYSAQNKADVWTEIKMIDLANDTTTIGHPAISEDESLMIFSSNLQGGQGGLDLWYSLYDKKSSVWGAPVNLGPGINTSGNEVYPFLHDDGTLYFSSDTHHGMGGMDIFKAEKTGNNSWGDVTNMKFPINSPKDDFGIIFEGKSERGFLTSNRDGVMGSDDIFSFVLPPLLFVLQGNVTDLNAKTPIEGAVIKLVGTDGTSVEKKTDNTGFYQYAENGDSRYLLPNTTYTITVTAPDYLNGKGKETTVGVTQSTTFIKDFALQPTRRGTKVEEIPMPEVQYDLGSYTLRPESKDSLDFLYNVLIDNPTIVIELAAHTDSRGSDKANKTLSENRAKSCVEYLISKGIPSDRMKPVGYGESKLKITDAQIAKLKSVEEKEAAHQKNRRTVFSVVRTDYIPKTGN